MKNIYLVQVDVASGSENKTLYLPYAAGLLAAYSWKDPVIAQSYRFKGFVYERKSVRDVVNNLENPYLIGFSCYVWNTEYNKLLAQAIKEYYPECIIVFGGHNVPDDTSMLVENSFIDILVHGEGERVFKEILLCLTDRKKLSSVGNISIRESHGKTARTAYVKPGQLDDLPSPYLEGYFDKIVSSGKLKFNAIFETSRGCPNNCAYCDWGLLNAKTRQFPLDRVLSEIDWISEHKISFLWGADANFGMFRRDMIIVDALVNAKKTTGFPEKMRMSYSKSNVDRVFEISRKLKEYDFDRNGVTLSFQSLSPVVLENIGRKNMAYQYFQEVFAKYNKANIRTYSELILGLPGETLQSFKEGVGKLLELGQHFLFEIYGCVLLPNSSMGQKEYIERFELESVRVEIPRYHCEPGNLDIPEYNNLVVSTSTMSKSEWVECMVFGYMVKSMHCSGLLRIFAIYLYYEQHVPYQIFYSRLLDFLENAAETGSSTVYQELKAHAQSITKGNAYPAMIFDPCGNITWNDDEYAALKYLFTKDTFYSDLYPFLQSFNVETELFENLLAYQKAVLREPMVRESTVDLKYDLHDFFESVYANSPRPLMKKRIVLRLTDTALIKDWKEYGEKVVWFGKFGCCFYKDNAEIIY